MSLWAIDLPKVELRPNTNESELQILIWAVYKQVLGNAHLLESKRIATIESQLRDRNISVREFVNSVAKSELYQRITT
ncbi:MAG: phycobilisome rod-core linker polypeptide [Nostoc sp.]|uniref:phycobilisome rod-core linker polypeptide n=1 Tax=Nostoc sp. TaxID=1180 RepID=UPI002FFA33D3